MRRRLAIAAALALGWSLIGASPAAEADTPPCVFTDYDTAVEDMICWPMQPNTTVVIQGPRYMWGMRKVARYVDSRIDRLAIVSNVGVRCSEPQFVDAFCITVRKRVIDDPKQDVWGWYLPNEGRFDSTATSGLITLNSRHNRAYLPDRQWAAGHEFLHALGMQHHVRDGSGPYNANGQGMLAESSMATLPSRTEIAYLRLWYDTPCGPC